MPNIIDGANTWLAIGALVANLAQWAYVKYDHYYLIIQKVRRFCSGRFIDFSVGADFVACEDVKPLEEVDEHLRRCSQRYRKTSHTTGSLTAHVDDWQVKAYLDRDTFSQRHADCHYQMRYPNASPWHAMALLRRSHAILQQLQERLRPQDHNYSIQLEFHGSNPYMPRALRGIDSKSIESMVSVVRRHDSPDVTITISPHQIGIGARDASDAYEVAEHFVSLRRV